MRAHHPQVPALSQTGWSCWVIRSHVSSSGIHCQPAGVPPSDIVSLKDIIPNSEGPHKLTWLLASPHNEHIPPPGALPPTRYRPSNGFVFLVRRAGINTSTLSPTENSEPLVYCCFYCIWAFVTASFACFQAELIIKIIVICNHPGPSYSDPPVVIGQSS